ncbi:MAG TPA: alpha/beta hydrolase [Vicinamibacterales bacterium]|jgi:haloacetate dehalogenase|nr:alpha/beta hydrolase [Vicinamibacterales bacterium]
MRGGSIMNVGDRRSWLRQMGILTAGVAAAGLRNAEAQPETGGASRFFPGFKASTVQTSGATINVVMAGQGPPVLLLHGAPQTHVSWRLVAPKLAARFTVVATDLRGYGDSSKPPDGDGHSNYSKRAMALDQVEVMRHFGFERFAVVGHDRGGRVGHRMALDHPDRVTKLVTLDIVPTYYLYTHVTIEFVQAYFHWFNYLRAAPGPENQLKADYEAQAARATSDVQREYLRTSSDPANIHAMCEDYRAGASIDLKHDEADLSKKIACPLLVLWGERGPMGRIFDVLAIWKERGVTVTGRSMPSGHNIQEDAPDQVLAELQGFLP